MDNPIHIDKDDNVHIDFTPKCKFCGTVLNKAEVKSGSCAKCDPGDDE